MFFLSALTMVAQEKHLAYAELLGFQKGIFSTKVTVNVDLGQSVSFWKQHKMKIIDENGKDMVFNSMVDAMNFMGERGWRFLQAYVVTEGMSNVYHWLLCKEVANNEEIKEGIRIKSDLDGADPDEIKKLFEKGDPGAPEFQIVYQSKSKSSTRWDDVNTEFRETLSEEDITAIRGEWESKTNADVDYRIQIKRKKEAK